MSITWLAIEFIPKNLFSAILDRNLGDLMLKNTLNVF